MPRPRLSVVVASRPIEDWPDEAPALRVLLAEIRRLWRDLRALPCGDRDDCKRGERRHASPACLALEAQIKHLSDRYLVAREETTI